MFRDPVGDLCYFKFRIYKFFYSDQLAFFFQSFDPVLGIAIHTFRLMSAKVTSLWLIGLWKLQLISLKSQVTYDRDNKIETENRVEKTA